MQIVPQAFYLILALLLIAAAASDVRRYLIPNWIPLVVAALFPLYVIALHSFGPENFEVRWLASMVVAAVVFAIFVALFAFGVMGGGDVKLIGATSLWAGPELIAAFFIITALVGGLLALVFLATSKLRGSDQSRAGEKPESMSDGSFAEAGLTTASETEPRPEKARVQIPYGVAIACGGIFISGKQIINHFSQ